jgi:threonine dehydratase
MERSSELKNWNKDVLLEARSRIRPYVHRTPVFTSEYFNRLTGSELFFKCENLQKVGAFKMRGAANALLSLPEELRKKGVATHSSGNHAQALAKAAQMTGIPAYIVMPSNAPHVKVQAVKGYQARVFPCEPTLKAREEKLAEVVEETGAFFIPPYNHPDIITGQATAAMELLEEVPDLQTIMAPVGGGGLLSGTALAARFFSQHCLVYGAEPEGASDAKKSFEQGRIIPSENPDTIADGLLTSLGDLTYSLIRELVLDILLVNDREILQATKMVMERMKLVIEPSAAVPLAAAIRNPGVFEGKKTGIIFSGGNVDLVKLMKML